MTTWSQFIKQMRVEKQGFFIKDWDTDKINRVFRLCIHSRRSTGRDLTAEKRVGKSK